MWPADKEPHNLKVGPFAGARFGGMAESPLAKGVQGACLNPAPPSPTTRQQPAHSPSREGKCFLRAKWRSFCEQMAFILEMFFESTMAFMTGGAMVSATIEAPTTVG